MIVKFTCPGGHVLQGLEIQLGQPCTCPQCGTKFTVQTVSPADSGAAAPVVPYSVSTPAALPRAVPLQTAEPRPETAGSADGDGIPDFNAEWRNEGFSFGGRDVGANDVADPAAAHGAADFTTPSPADDAADFLSSVSASGADRFDASELEDIAGSAAADRDIDLPSGGDLPGVVAKKFYHIRCPKKHLLEVRGESLNSDIDCPACGTRFRIRLDRTLEFRRKREQEIERHDAKSGQVWLSIAIAAGVLIVLALLAALIMGNH